MNTQRLTVKALEIEREIKKIVRLLKVGKLKSYLLNCISNNKGEVNLLGVVGLVYLGLFLVVLFVIF